MNKIRERVCLTITKYCLESHMAIPVNYAVTCLDIKVSKHALKDIQEIVI